jgi:hypothetical protein
MKGISKLVEKVLPKKEFLTSIKKNIRGKALPYFLAGSLALGTMYGCKKEKIEPIPLPNNPPVASISLNPSGGESPLTSTIKVNGTDKDGLDDIKSYILKIEDLGINIERNKPIDTTMVFSKHGRYEAKGIVKDKDGASSEASSYLNVSEKPQVIVSQKVSLKDSVNIFYEVDFENLESVQLDILKNNEKIFSKDISESGYSELFTYETHEQKITIGDYKFIANFKTAENKDTSDTKIIELIDYPIEFKFNNHINFPEDSFRIIRFTEENWYEPNPDQRPVECVSEDFDGGEKTSVEFNSETNELKIQGNPDEFGDYILRGKVRNSEGEITSFEKQGHIYKLARLSGIIENNETREGIQATIVPYEIINQDTIRLFSKTADSEARNLTDNFGNFYFKLNKKEIDLENVLLMARQGIPENYKGWVRVQNIPKEEFENVLMRAVPYAPYEDRKDEFKSFVIETTIMPPPFQNPEFPYFARRFDFDGSILGGLPEYENYTGLKRIRILDEDPYTGGTFTREEQEVFKEKLLDKDNIGGIIGYYEIKENQIVFGNDISHEDYVWNENHEPAVVNPSNGIIVVVPRKDLYATGVAATTLGTHPIHSRGVVYLKSGDYNDSTFPHEMGHLFISANHPESLYGETIMSSPIPGWMDYTRPGPADKKLGSIVYEKSYLIKLSDKLYERPDYIKNILRNDFK